MPEPPLVPMMPCARCGAQMRVVALEGNRGTGACVECGLGVSLARLTATRVVDDPERAADQRRAIDAQLRSNWRDAARSLTFPVYGLDARWSRSRFVGGYGGLPIDRFTLGHGAAFDSSGPQLRVETIAADERLPAGHRRMNVAMEVRSFLQSRAFRDPPPAPAVQAALRDLAAFEGRRRTHVLLESAPLDVRILLDRDEWIAIGTLDRADLVISARSVAIEDVHLVAIDDLEPYLAEMGQP